MDIDALKAEEPKLKHLVFLVAFKCLTPPPAGQTKGVWMPYSAAFKIVLTEEVLPAHVDGDGWLVYGQYFELLKDAASNVKYLP